MNDRASVEVRICRSTDLDTALRRTLEGWFSVEWPDSPYSWSQPEWYGLATNGELLVGRVGIVNRQIHVGEETVHVGGVSGVITDAGWRRRGVARALLDGSVQHIAGTIGASFGLCVL